MKYRDGREVKVGDLVALGKDRGGVVVASVDADEYSSVCTREVWSYLERGVLIDFPLWGLIHYEEPDEDLEFISASTARGSP